jgi:hypothetical protein
MIILRSFGMRSVAVRLMAPDVEGEFWLGSAS